MEIYATRAEIDDSQFFVWYRELQAVSIKSEIIPLSKSFIEYLQEDGIILPPHLDKFISSTDNNDEWDSEEDVDKDRNVETCQAAVSSIAPDWDFVDLDRDITLAMNRLGGEVFIKVNWSAPLDVSWMTMGSLKAFSLRDIYLQLKSSDRIIYDLEHMYDNCHDEGPKMPDQPVLVLRKWANLHPSMEFRLFVNEGNLVGVCQRDCCNFYPFLRSKIDDLLEILQRFYFANVAPKSLPRKCTYLIELSSIRNFYFLSLFLFSLYGCLYR